VISYRDKFFERATFNNCKSKLFCMYMRLSVYNSNTKPQLTTSNFLFTIHSKFYLFLQMNRHYRQHALSLYSKGFRYILSILIIYSNGLALRKFSKKQYACWGGDGIYTCMTRGTRLYGRLSSLQLIEANTYRYLHELISPASIQL